jgi:CRP/FNR family transcriptional regulator, cyclic AMP receptor protein
MQLTRIEFLQRMPIFGALRDDALRLLLAHAEEVTAEPGECYFHQDDEARSMFVLESGRVEVVKSWQGREFVLNDLGAGDCFGEMALMDLFPRSASVRAVEPCVAIEFGSGDLMHLAEHDLEQFALIQMNIGREVCRRLRATDELLFRLRIGEMPTVPMGLFRAS